MRIVDKEAERLPAKVSEILARRDRIERFGFDVIGIDRRKRSMATRR